MLKKYFSIICLLSFHIYNHASSSAFQVKLSDKVKQRMLENLSNYQTLINEDEKGAEIKESDACKTFLSLHEEVANDKVSEQDLQVAQNVLNRILQESDSVNQLRMQARQQAVKIKEEKKETITAKEIEEIFAGFRRKVANDLIIDMRKNTGIAEGFGPNNESRKKFVLQNKQLSAQACGHLKQTALALYQLAPLIDSEVEAVLKQ